MRALITLAPANIPRLDEARVDSTVLLFTLALSVVTGVLFGLAPAMRTSGGNGENLTHATTRHTVGGASGNGRRLFVIGQFALALVLLAGAGLLIRSLFAVHSVDSGFGDRSVITAQLRFHNALPRQRRARCLRRRRNGFGGCPACERSARSARCSGTAKGQSSDYVPSMAIRTSLATNGMY
jgi:putative ABC transport system permease protein